MPFPIAIVGTSENDRYVFVRGHDRWHRIANAPDDAKSSAIARQLADGRTSGYVGGERWNWYADASTWQVDKTLNWPERG